MLLSLVKLGFLTQWITITVNRQDGRKTFKILKSSIATTIIILLTSLTSTFVRILTMENTTTNSNLCNMKIKFLITSFMDNIMYNISIVFAIENKGPSFVWWSLEYFNKWKIGNFNVRKPHVTSPKYSRIPLSYKTSLSKDKCLR